MRVNNAFSSILYSVIILTGLFDGVIGVHHDPRRAFSRHGGAGLPPVPDHKVVRRGFFPDDIFGGGMFPPPPSSRRPPPSGGQKPQPGPNPEPQPTSPNDPLDLTNIQADMIFPIDSSAKTFLFFKITDSNAFKNTLSSTIHDRITTAAQASNQAPSATAINMGFTIDGLHALGNNDDIGDNSFSQGQANDASAMGDPGTANWVDAFKGTDVHGVFMVAAGSKDAVNGAIGDVFSAAKGSISEVYRLEGAKRPGDQAGHEHFGFKDGLSQPCLNGFTDCSQPGITALPPGVIITGGEGDNGFRPQWTAGGSFMAFRQLQQLVPEFQNFARKNAIKMPGLSTDEGAELLQARMFGRWKDGTPLDLSPLKPDPALASDPLKNNNFTYSHPGSDLSSDQTRCPFSAHIRKTNPRDDLPNNINHIVRSSIVYGGEVTPAEAKAQTTQQDRGLAFVAYQASIPNGFLFQQQSWADSTSFPFNKNQTVGFDAIIGANGGQPRETFGLDPTDASKSLTLPDFVRSKGGAYFFFPPLSALSRGGTLTQ